MSMIDNLDRSYKMDRGIICASCKTTKTTEYRVESNWELCLECHLSWLECEEEFNEELKENK
jgi:hypothetical protein